MADAPDGIQAFAAHLADMSRDKRVSATKMDKLKELGMALVENDLELIQTILALLQEQASSAFGKIIALYAFDALAQLCARRVRKDPKGRETAKAAEAGKGSPQSFLQYLDGALDEVVGSFVGNDGVFWADGLAKVKKVLDIWLTNGICTAPTVERNLKRVGDALADAPQTAARAPEASSSTSRSKDPKADAKSRPASSSAKPRSSQPSKTKPTGGSSSKSGSPRTTTPVGSPPSHLRALLLAASRASPGPLALHEPSSAGPSSTPTALEAMPPTDGGGGGSGSNEAALLGALASLRSSMAAPSPAMQISAETESPQIASLLQQLSSFQNPNGAVPPATAPPAGGGPSTAFAALSQLAAGGRSLSPAPPVGPNQQPPHVGPSNGTYGGAYGGPPQAGPSGFYPTPMPAPTLPGFGTSRGAQGYPPHQQQGPYAPHQQQPPGQTPYANGGPPSYPAGPSSAPGLSQPPPAQQPTRAFVPPPPVLANYGNNRGVGGGGGANGGRGGFQSVGGAAGRGGFGGGGGLRGGGEARTGESAGQGWQAYGYEQGSTSYAQQPQRQPQRSFDGPRGGPADPTSTPTPPLEAHQRQQQQQQPQQQQQQQRQSFPARGREAAFHANDTGEQNRRRSRSPLRRRHSPEAAASGGGESGGAKHVGAGAAENVSLLTPSNDPAPSGGPAAVETTRQQQQQQQQPSDSSNSAALTLATFSWSTFDPSLPAHWEALNQAFFNSNGRWPSQEEAMACVYWGMSGLGAGGGAGGGGGGKDYGQGGGQSGQQGYPPQPQQQQQQQQQQQGYPPQQAYQGEEGGGGWGAQ